MGRRPSADDPDVVGRPAASPVELSLQPDADQRLAEQYVAQGRVVSPAEYDRLFGATRGQVDTVASWLRAKGLRVTSVDRVSGSVGATAPASTVERAMRTSLATARARGHRGLVATTAPVLPVSLGVSSVVGLSSMALTAPRHVNRTFRAAGTLRSGVPPPVRSPRPQPGSHRRQGVCDLLGTAPQRLDEGLRPPVQRDLRGYRPKDLPRMYGVTSAAAQAPTVAIVGAYTLGNLKNITNEYMRTPAFAYPQAHQLHGVPVGGERYQSECDKPAWGGEQALDVQATHAVAPAGEDPLLRGAQLCPQRHAGGVPAGREGPQGHDGLVVVRLTDEAQLPAALHAAWTKATLQASLAGISVFASSGDDGDNSRVTGGRRAVDVPAAYAYVTAVGGTSEGATAAGKVVARTGWEDRTDRKGAKGWTSLGFLWGAGGGASSRVPQPSWQVGKVPAGRRAVPDVAALADPFTGFTTYYAGRYSVVGGTSLAAPVVGFGRRAVQGAHGAQGRAGVPLALPVARHLGAARCEVRQRGHLFPFGPPAPARDPGSYVVGFDRRPQGDLQSRPGWDNVTGVGTPNGTTFLDAFGR